MPSVSDATFGSWVGSHSSPSRSRLLDDLLGADELLDLGDRDVERVLQRVTNPDRAALVVVRVVDLVSGHDLGLDVHEHGGRGDGPGLEAGGVGDGFEG